MISHKDNIEKYCDYIYEIKINRLYNIKNNYFMHFLDDLNKFGFSKKINFFSENDIYNLKTFL